MIKVPKPVSRAQSDQSLARPRGFEVASNQVEKSQKLSAESPHDGLSKSGVKWPSFDLTDVLARSSAASAPAAGIGSSVGEGVIQRVHHLSSTPSNRATVELRLRESRQRGKTKPWRMKKRQQAIDLVVADLHSQGVLSAANVLEMRRKDRRGLYFKPGGTNPRGGTDQSPGMIYREPPGHDPNTQAQAFPPGYSGGNAKPAEVEVYDGAASQGAAFLYSKLVHESNHVGQYQHKKDVVGGGFIHGQNSAKYLGAAQEVEAYGSEILSAQHTGLADNEAHLDQVYNRYIDHHNQVGPGGSRRRYLSSDQTTKVNDIHAGVEPEYRRLKAIHTARRAGPGGAGTTP